MSTNGRALAQIQRIKIFEKKTCEKKLFKLNYKRLRQTKTFFVYFNVLNVLLSSNLHHSFKNKIFILKNTN